jgi:hypothetical protein
VSFFQVTVVPAGTLRVVGEKVLANRQKVLAGQAGGGGGGGGGVTELSPLPPHDRTPIDRIRTPNRPEILGIPPPLAEPNQRSDQRDINRRRLESINKRRA